MNMFKHEICLYLLTSVFLLGDDYLQIICLLVKIPNPT